jgi:hypothetical protein
VNILFRDLLPLNIIKAENTHKHARG